MEGTRGVSKVGREPTKENYGVLRRVGRYDRAQEHFQESRDGRGTHYISGWRHLDGLEFSHQRNRRLIHFHGRAGDRFCGGLNGGTGNLLRIGRRFLLDLGVRNLLRRKGWADQNSAHREESRDDHHYPGNRFLSHNWLANLQNLLFPPKNDLLLRKKGHGTLKINVLEVGHSKFAAEVFDQYAQGALGIAVIRNDKIGAVFQGVR